MIKSVGGIIFLNNKYLLQLRDKKKNLPCSAYLQGEYEVKGLYVGVPVVLGANGVEKIVEINLKKEEKKEFMKSVNSVKEVVNIAKKII